MDERSTQPSKDSQTPAMPLSFNPTTANIHPHTTNPALPSYSTLQLIDCNMVSAQAASAKRARTAKEQRAKRLRNQDVGDVRAPGITRQVPYKARPSPKVPQIDPYELPQPGEGGQSVVP